MVKFWLKLNFSQGSLPCTITPPPSVFLKQGTETRWVSSGPYYIINLHSQGGTMEGQVTTNLGKFKGFRKKFFFFFKVNGWECGGWTKIHFSV